MPAATPNTAHHEAALVARCLAALRDLGIGKVETLIHRPSAIPPTPLRPDAWLRLQGPWGKATYACEAKRRVTAEMVGAVANRLERMTPAQTRGLLLIEYVTPDLAKLLRQRGLEFVDAAGNAHLCPEGLRVWTLGSKPAARPTTRGHAFRPAGLRVLFQILRAPKEALDFTYREMATKAGIALGGVGAILEDLRGQGILARQGTRLVLAEPQRAQARFEEGYAERLRPKLDPLVCRRRPDARWDTLVAGVREQYPMGEVALGGELGTAELTHGLRPQAATLHVAGVELRQLMRMLDLLPDARGDVTLLGPIDGATSAPTRSLIADPLLLRAEILLHPDDRLNELADVLQAEYVEPRWTR